MWWNSHLQQPPDKCALCNLQLELQNIEYKLQDLIQREVSIAAIITRACKGRASAPAGSADFCAVKDMPHLMQVKSHFAAVVPVLVPACAPAICWHLCCLGQIMFTCKYCCSTRLQMHHPFYDTQIGLQAELDIVRIQKEQAMVCCFILTSPCKSFQRAMSVNYAGLI